MWPFEIWLAAAREHRLTSGRPLVSLCYAQSLDGSLTDRRGQPMALSGLESTHFTHRLRSQHAAILVGIGTVLADDPQLTDRLASGTNPRPIVLDTFLRMPLQGRLMQSDRTAPRPWIVTAPPVDKQKRLALEATGAQVLQMPSIIQGEIDLPTMLNRLGDLGIDSLMVEGGAQVITSFLADDLVDIAMITLAPMMIGGWHVITPSGLADRARQMGYPRLFDMGIDRLGADILIWGRFK
jgi:riboflavin-specific deaminase-like protein